MMLIALRNGPTVPVPVLELGWSLESRGLTLKVEGDKLRVSGPGGVKPTLTPEDVEAIRKYKVHLMAVLAMEPSPL